VINLIGLFLTKCTENDHNKLIKYHSYLRFQLYQDAPDSSPYVYIRDIKDCAFESQKYSLMLCRKSMNLPCEVNFRSSGYFYEFGVDEWINKNVAVIIGFD
jgi:hypothetical protein